MDVQDWLQSVVGDCTLLSEPDEAIALIPDIGVDGPPLVSLRLDGQGVWKGFPAVYASRLRGPLARLVVAELGRWKEGAAPDALSVARPELLVEDELVAVVTELIAEACAHDRRLASGVMLEIARQSAALVAGRIDEWDGFAEVLNLPRLASELSQAPAPDQARACQALTWALAGRLSAAWALAAQLDPGISPTRFYQAMVVNKLVFTHPAGSLDSASYLGLIAAIEGVEIEADRLNSAYLAVVAAVQKVLAGGDDALSQSLRDMMGARTNPTALALDPALASAILHRLDDLLDARALKDAGVSKRDLKALQKGPGIAAVSAAYTRCARVMRGWDLLSAAAGRSVPVGFRGVSAETRLGRLEASACWGLLVPRGGGGVTQSTVVALDFSALNHYVATRADRTRGLTLGLAAFREKLARIAARMEGIAGRTSSFELFVFTHPGSAESFLRQVRDSLSAIHLDRGPFGRPTPVANDIWIQSHVASGEVMGGWDGSSLRIWGPAVDDACRGATGAPSEVDHYGAEDGSLEGVGSLLSSGAPPPPQPAPQQAAAPGPRPPQQQQPASLPKDPFATMGDPFSQEVPASLPEHDRAPPGPEDDPFSSLEVSDDDESEDELFGAGDTFIIEAPGDSSEEEDPDFENPFDDEARTALTDIGTLRASGANQDLIDTAREALQERGAHPAAPMSVEPEPLDPEPLDPEPLDPEPEELQHESSPLGDPIDVEGLEADGLDPFGDHEITELTFGDPPEPEEPAQTELSGYAPAVASVDISAFNSDATRGPIAQPQEEPDPDLEPLDGVEDDSEFPSDAIIASFGHGDDAHADFQDDGDFEDEVIAALEDDSAPASGFEDEESLTALERDDVIAALEDDEEPSSHEVLAALEDDEALDDDVIAALEDDEDPFAAWEDDGDPVSLDVSDASGDDSFLSALPDAPGELDDFDELAPTHSGVPIGALPDAPGDLDDFEDLVPTRGDAGPFSVPVELEPLADEVSDFSEVVVLGFGDAASSDAPLDDALLAAVDEESAHGEAVQVGFDEEPAVDEDSEIGEAVLVGFDEPAADDPSSFSLGESAVDEESEIGEAVLVGFDNEPAVDEDSEIGEAVLVGFDEPSADEESLPGEAVLVGFDDEPAADEPVPDEESEIGEAVLVGFDDEPAADEPSSFDFGEPAVDEESEIGEAVLVGFDDEPAADEPVPDEESEIGEAVLVGFDDMLSPGDEPDPEPVEDEFSEAEHTLEIVDDEGSEYEYVIDDDSELDDPNTDLDGYFLPGEIAAPEELEAAAADSDYYLPPPAESPAEDEPEFYLPSPDEAEEEPSQDEITFNVPLTREPPQDEDVDDSRTFDLELDAGLTNTPNLAGTEPLGEADSDPSSEAILSLDDGPLDLPGEPPDSGIYQEGSDFVLSDPDSIGNGVSGGDSLSWLDQVEEEPLDEASSVGDSYSNSTAALPDLEYLFQGYVVFTDDQGTVCFGRKYGKRLLDVHTYEVRGQLGSAYQSFLNDKVSEGFVPRADLTRSMPSDVPVEAVDLEEMGRAFRVLAAR